MSKDETKTPQPEPRILPLTKEKAARMAHAIRRLKILQASKIATANKDAELRGIQTMLLTELPKHADELLGCWFAIHREYEPLVESAAALIRRANQVNMERAVASQRQQSQEEVTPNKS